MSYQEPKSPHIVFYWVPVPYRAQQKIYLSWTTGHDLFKPCIQTTHRKWLKNAHAHVLVIWIWTILTKNLPEGDIRVYIWAFFSSSISVISISMWAVTVSFSSAVCGFSSFWLTVFSKRRSFTVSQYRSFVLSSLIIQFNRACDTKHSRLFLGQHIDSGKWLHNFWQSIYAWIVVACHDQAFRSVYR